MSKLPSLQDLSLDITAAGKQDELNLLLNQQPPASWVKQHPFAKGVSYLPIDKIEMLLTRIFQQWKVEVIKTEQLFNSVAVTVRLHYRNPLTGEWLSHDGVGAVGVQTDKGAAASDLNAIKHDAIMKALPAAKSYAIKDAAENIGALFGANLNRRDVVEFTPSYVDLTKQRALEWLQKANPTPEQIAAFWADKKHDKYREDADFAQYL